MCNEKLRAVSIYLPQYHPISVNDAAWGKGFTEWTNVVKAKPLFKNHYQPHLPADLGFYDLRVSEVREQQAKLAKEHGIYGFCYYHYWFNGKRILERPFQEVFESGKPDFPFMLCWANENWTKKWDGSNKEVLLEQNYSAKDDRKHIQTLIPYFQDPRYIRINNKPVIAIYRSTLLPAPEKTIQIWREEAFKHGLELYICRFESFSMSGKKYLQAGFDAAIDFQPWGRCMNEYKLMLLERKQTNLDFKLKNFILREIIGRFSEKHYKKFRQDFKKKELATYFFDYEDYVNFVLSSSRPDYKLYPCVTPMWDNTARYQNNPGLFYNSSPIHYKKWLKETIQQFQPYSDEENLLFINAWNEWAEGCHLEPCQRWGRSYLEATKQAIEEHEQESERRSYPHTCL